MGKGSKLLFQGNVYTPLSCFSLVGDNTKIWHPSDQPFLGLAPINFGSGEVTVGTINGDETEENIEVTIYDGTPEEKDLRPGLFSASGILEVGKTGIIFDPGGSEVSNIDWPEGFTAVVVILNAIEVDKNEIKHITFFLKDMGKRLIKNPWLRLLLRR